MGVQRYDRDGKTWIHLLNYRYDEAADRVMPVEKLELTLRNVAGKAPEILAPEGSPVPECETTTEGNAVRVILRNAGLYTVLAFG